jgi:hypothetical protein
VGPVTLVLLVVSVAVAAVFPVAITITVTIRIPFATDWRTRTSFFAIGRLSHVLVQHATCF